MQKAEEISEDRTYVFIQEKIPQLKNKKGNEGNIRRERYNNVNEIIQNDEEDTTPISNKEFRETIRNLKLGKAMNYIELRLK